MLPKYFRLLTKYETLSITESTPSNDEVLTGRYYLRKSCHVEKWVSNFYFQSNNVFFRITYLKLVTDETLA